MNKSLQDYLNSYDLDLCQNSGREIARPKALVYDHTGIIMGINKYSKNLMVFHNHPNTGPAIVTIQEFMDGEQYYFTDNPHDAWNVVLIRSFRQVEAQNAYNVTYNCQHASSFARKGEASSSGLKGTLAVAAIAILFGGFFGSQE
jgi:hypothetical protein